MSAQQSNEASSCPFKFDPIEEALEAFGKGEFVVVMDDEGRENEGDLVIAASEITTKKMAWFIRHTRSVSRLVCWELEGCPDKH
jgi:3,4-dihydroxy 2-butanone 4-phosphate synthase